MSTGRTSTLLVMLVLGGELFGYTISESCASNNEGIAPNGCAANNNDMSLCKHYNSKNIGYDIKRNGIPHQTLAKVLQNRKCYCKDVWDRDRRGQLGHFRLCPVTCFPCYASCPNDSNAVSKETAGDKRQYLDPRSVCMDGGDEHDYYIVRSCPDDYENVTVKMFCEKPIPIQSLDFAMVEFLTGEDNGITYFNKYCAECNGIHKVRKWRLSITCISGLPLVEAITENDIIRVVMSEGADCSFVHIPTEKDDGIRCLRRFYKKEHLIISSCNVTGRETFVTGFEEKCSTTPSTLDRRVLNEDYMFKNIFCLVCNIQMIKTAHPTTCEAPPTTESAFSNLFGFGLGSHSHSKDEAVESNKTTCQATHWKDPQGVCRKLFCAKGKILQKGVCKTAFDMRMPLPFRMSLLLVSHAHEFSSEASIKNSSIEEVTDSIVVKIKDVMQLSTGFEIQIGVALDMQAIKSPSDETYMVNRSSNITHQQLFMLPRFVWLKLFVIFYAPVSEVERSANHFNKENITIPTSSSYSTSYHVYFLNEFSYNVNISCNDHQGPHSCGTSVVHLEKVEFRFREISRRLERYGNVPTSEFVEIKPHPNCSYVEVLRENVQETIDTFPVPHITKIALRFGHFTFEFAESHEINQLHRGDDTTFYVCRDLLNSIVPLRIHYAEVTSVFGIVQYYMTIICVTISLMCLSATVVTYCLFPDLCCVAGCNTLGLSLSLMVAQVFLFVASAIQGPSTLCTVIGVVTHYSWLVMFAWMFICCLHMFQVFAGLRSTAKSSRRKENREKVTNLLLSLGVPALIVMIITVTYNVTYDGARIGYGYRTCAMDSPFAIHGPLIFVIVCDCVFFIVAVCQIWGIRRLQHDMTTKKKDNKDFVIYVKLSTLTGMFWLVVILGEVFYNDIIRCIAIVLNGFQGVFIFASFTANHKVLGYYKDKIYDMKRRSASNKSSIGTTATMAS